MYFIKLLILNNFPPPGARHSNDKCFCTDTCTGLEINFSHLCLQSGGTEGALTLQITHVQTRCVVLNIIAHINYNT